jgi:hypothetical protein
MPRRLLTGKTAAKWRCDDGRQLQIDAATGRRLPKQSRLPKQKGPSPGLFKV